MENKNIVFIDGVCTLCNRVADWIIKHDRQNKFYVASLQGKTASKYVHLDQTDPLQWSVLVRTKEGVLLNKSDAVLRICAELGGWCKIFMVFYILPLRWRDALYNFVAQRRYKWFKPMASCRMPRADEKDKFLP